MAGLAAAYAAVAVACVLLAPSSAARSKAEVRWRQLVHLPGAVDVVGPRADGRFVAMGTDGLFLVRRSGSLTPFARGIRGYVRPRGETYMALARNRRVTGTGCSFRRDDLYVLDPVDHPGLTLVDRAGHARRFADLPAGSFLSGIAYDTVGRFGYRLLVTALVSQRTTLYAIDCRGQARVVGRNLAKVEGGSAVAPSTFGKFSGRLIASDETNGSIYAFGPRGHVRVVAHPVLAVGGDIGVESVGFVPRRFTRSGSAYFADLHAPGSPTQGTDNILALSGVKLMRARVRAGDLVVATEAGGVTVAVRCSRTCVVRRIARASDATHGEGHIAFAAG
jgi:hypothetical protein